MAERKNEAIWIKNRQRWQINIQDDGERKTFTSSTPGKKGKIEAEKKADAWLKDKQVLTNIRIGKLFELFLNDIANSTGTGNWKNHEKNGRLYLLPKLKSKKASAVTCQDWQNLIYAAAKSGAKGKPLAKDTLDSIRETISAVYRFAKRSKIPMERPEDLIIPTTAKKPNKSSNRRTLRPYLVVIPSQYAVRKLKPSTYIPGALFYYLVCVVAKLQASRRALLKIMFYISPAQKQTRQTAISTYQSV